MAGEAKHEEPFWDPVALRRGILIATGVETAYLFLTIALAAMSKSSQGIGVAQIVVVLTTLVFLSVVLPAMALAYFNHRLEVAVGLAAIAGMIYFASAFALG